MSEKLAYTGKIISTESIENANRIHLSVAVCGPGGKWSGITPIDMKTGDSVVVFLPDSILPSDSPDYAFMEQHKFRVKQRRFRGCPSEALIMPYSGTEGIGEDVTEEFKVTKYEKPGLMHLSAESKGLFPEFLRKTDEALFQKVIPLLGIMQNQGYQISLKMDGMSATAFRWQGNFGVCSRNLELKDGNNPMWNLAREYSLETRVPEGFAIQFEVCGPRIQDNPAGLKKIEGYCFQVWDIKEHKYLDFSDYIAMIDPIMPRPKLLESGPSFLYSADELQKLAETVKYQNGQPAEGIVVRPQIERWEFCHREFTRVSYKVINLSYKGQ